MNFSNIISQIEKADPKAYEEVSGRRSLLKSFGAKVAVAALPIAIGSMFNKASAKTATTSPVDAMNTLLEMKYFEYNYFHTANNTGSLIPGSPGLAGNDLDGFLSIESHLKLQIAFLQNTITQMAGTPFVPKHYNASALNPLFVPLAYDFTAGNTYLVFSNYTTFLTIGQLFCDGGVRMIQGFMPVFLGNGTLLTQMLEMQCTEARHAAHIRLVRRNMGIGVNADYPAPWITNNVPPSAVPIDRFQAWYAGEDNVTQSGIYITSLTDVPAGGTVPKISATAAFDEPMDAAALNTLMYPFKL